MKNEHQKGLLLLIITSILWSTGGIFIKLMHWNSFAIAGMRCMIAAVVMLVYIKKPFIRITLSQGIATVAYALSVILIVLANRNTTAANAVLLTYTSPIYTAIGSRIVLGEKITRKDIISIAIILAGILLFAANGLAVGNWFGDAVALLSGISFGIMVVFLRKEKENNAVLCTFWGNVVTFLVCLPFMENRGTQTSDIICILMLGVFQLGVSYILYTQALKNVPALEANIVTVLEPVLNPLWVFLFYGEKPTFLALLGGVVILTGVLYRELGNKN